MRNALVARIGHRLAAVMQFLSESLARLLHRLAFLQKAGSP